MKRTKFLVFLFALIATVCGVCLCACNSSCGARSNYNITVNENKPLIVEVGDEIDYTQYFIVKDANGNQLMITNDMLDLSKADTSMPGTFTVTLTVGSISKQVTFTVVPAGSGSVTGDYVITLNNDKSRTIEVGSTVDFTQYFTVKDKSGNTIVVTESMLDLSKVNTSKEGTFTITITVGNVSKQATFTVVAKGSSSTDLSAVFAKYADSSKWNFAVNFTATYQGESYEEYYEYLGDDILYRYELTDGSKITEYLSYDLSANKVYYYVYGSDGKYTKYDDSTTEFEENYAYVNIVDLSQAGNFSFSAAEDGYTANNPNEAGNAIIGQYENSTWTRLTVYAANGNITKIVAVMNDGYIMEFELVKHGAVNFKLPDASGGTTTPTEPTGIMEKQTYDPATFDKENLQDKMLKNDGSIGLPSKGDINALVIPVQFKNDTITQEQLNKLNIAFNGTSEQTGWESVKTYYQKASYGNLNLSFDIQQVYQASNTASYYEAYKEAYTEGNQTFYRTGEEIILTEVLAYYEPLIDLTRYDTNGDGCIDAVYLIYSAPVDYKTADSFYWAYVTWYYGSNKYDNLDTYFYLFAGFDFMDEDLNKMSGMKINAATYIHETGHLLGLDDYYDYDTSKGSNEGLGSADMMDYTVGDHNVYSKIMLGWLEPTIVNSTQTVTISSSQAAASAILIPLNFNNSYFCEYILIDLYSAEGLNKMHASMANTLLYDGAAYGARIYHVSSSVSNPYQSDFGSFTDNDNSMSDVALIKLVEADGEKKFASSGGYASQTDLWKTGDTLSGVFPTYMRNDGKQVIFDISFDSVSATSATITITYQS